MKNWKTIKLGDAATFINGYPFKPSDWREEGLEIIRIQNLTKSSSQSNYYKGTIDSKYKVKAGDFLISWSATLGIYEWSGNDAWLNQHIFKVVFDKHEFDKSFFKFLMSASLVKMEAQVHGATMKHITKKNFDSIPIPLPPLATQQKIAAILDAADELRQKDKALVAKYDELTQALFLDMFGDVITNSKNWNVSRFEEIISLKRGYDLPNNDRINGNIPVVASTGIVGFHNESKVKGGCIVTGRSGSIGKVQLITVDCWPLNTSLYGYRTFNNNLIYLKYFVSYFKIERFSHGAGVPTLDRKLVHKELAPIPPIKLQNQFAERVKAIEEQKSIAQASALKSEELFNSLLQKAFNGELV